MNQARGQGALGQLDSQADPMAPQGHMAKGQRPGWRELSPRGGEGLGWRGRLAPLGLAFASVAPSGPEDWGRGQPPPSSPAWPLPRRPGLLGAGRGAGKAGQVCTNRSAAIRGDGRSRLSPRCPLWGRPIRSPQRGWGCRVHTFTNLCSVGGQAGAALPLGAGSGDRRASVRVRGEHLPGAEQSFLRASSPSKLPDSTRRQAAALSFGDLRLGPPCVPGTWGPTP